MTWDELSVNVYLGGVTAFASRANVGLFMSETGCLWSDPGRFMFFKYGRRLSKIGKCDPSRFSPSVTAGPESELYRTCEWSPMGARFAVWVMKASVIYLFVCRRFFFFLNVYIGVRLLFFLPTVQSL